MVLHWESLVGRQLAFLPLGPRKLSKGGVLILPRNRTVIQITPVARDLGFFLFQGNFFLQPQILSAPRDLGHASQLDTPAAGNSIHNKKGRGKRSVSYTRPVAQPAWQNLRCQVAASFSIAAM